MMRYDDIWRNFGLHLDAMGYQLDIIVLHGIHQLYSDKIVIQCITNRIDATVNLLNTGRIFPQPGARGRLEKYFATTHYLLEKYFAYFTLGYI